MILYTFDPLGNYTGSVEHIKYAPVPERCTMKAPPEGPYPVWNGIQWELRDSPAMPPPAPLPSNAEQRAARQAAYQKEADPIFFMSQREEATEQEWLDKITEIKERYPYYYDDEGNLIEAQ